MKAIEEHLKQKFAGKIKELKNQENALVNLLMGEIMKLSNGKADPKIARALILKEINSTQTNERQI